MLLTLARVKPRRACLYIVSLLSLLFSLPASANISYLQTLIAAADEKNLADERHWHRLMHYETSAGQLKSMVQETYFFNAADGATNPRAELHATLAALVLNPTIAIRDEPARCVFPARYEWLDRQLGFDPDKLPQPNCERFAKWYAGLNPQQAYLVFPEAYNNGPSSMFGHTLLRIDGDKQAGLLAYAINYAADVEADNALFYAIKGLTGGYPGSYGIFPYYEKVKEYGHHESRDVWEYPLQLKAAELERLVLHLWELRTAHFPYLFLTRNCSYELLSMLEIARPDAELTNEFPVQAIPIDTIRAVAKTPNLLGKPIYRPAKGTELEHQLSQLDSSQQQCVHALANGEAQLDDACLSSQPALQQAQILETAQAYLYYGFHNDIFSREEMAPRSRKILIARSQIDIEDPFTDVPPPATTPEQGHLTARLALGVTHTRQQQKNQTSLLLQLRPAFHDQLDSSAGYSAGAQINFLDIKAHYLPERESLRLSQITLIDIMSLSPRDLFFKPISWRVATGLRRQPSQPIHTATLNNLGFYLQGGAGVTYGNIDRFSGYGFVLGSADANEDLNSGYRVALGGALGVRAEYNHRWNALLEAGLLKGQAGDSGEERWATAGWQWHFTQNNGLRLNYELRRWNDTRWTTLQASWQHYF